MKERPILFKGEMVRAILEGRKTQTRRQIKIPDWIDTVWNYDGTKEVPHCMIQKRQRPARYPDGPFELIEWSTDSAKSHAIKCPYGQPGDVLWVREDLYFDLDAGWKYSADETLVIDSADYSSKRTYCPSIHMPKAACRLWLRIKRVWGERVQDISEEDACAEGCSLTMMSPDGTDNGSYAYDFGYLWDSINGNWAENPWVWCVEFEKCEKPSRR